MIPPRTFWNFLVSRRASSSGLSIPMKTATIPASAISLHQLVVLGEVERGLGEERQREPVLVLPLDDRAEDHLGDLLVADEVVVDQEDHADPELVLGVDLGDDHLGRLDPGLAAEDDDDVAELALERAASRGLHAAHRVFLELDQVVSRDRDLGHVGLFDLLVAVLVQPLLPLA